MLHSMEHQEVAVGRVEAPEHVRVGVHRDMQCSAKNRSVIFSPNRCTLTASQTVAGCVPLIRLAAIAASANVSVEREAGQSTVSRYAVEHT